MCLWEAFFISIIVTDKAKAYTRARTRYCALGVTTLSITMLFHYAECHILFIIVLSVVAACSDLTNKDLGLKWLPGSNMLAYFFYTELVTKVFENIGISSVQCPQEWRKEEGYFLFTIWNRKDHFVESKSKRVTGKKGEGCIHHFRRQRFLSRIPFNHHLQIRIRKHLKCQYRILKRPR